MMVKDIYGFDFPKFKQPKPFKIKPKKINLSFGKASSREPLPAKIKNKVKDRGNNICEYRNCNHKQNLHFHHKNMKNSDSRVSNIELLCPNHHAVRHDQKIRKVVNKDPIMGTKTTRLVKKSNNKKKRKPKDAYSNMFKMGKW